MDDNSLSIDNISDSHEKLPLILENESVPYVKDETNKCLSLSNKMSFWHKSNDEIKLLLILKDVIETTIFVR